VVTGRLYRTVLCRCYDDRCQGRGVVGDGAAADAAQRMNVAGAGPSTSNNRDAGLDPRDDDDDDEELDAGALPRLRFEITFHRPCVGRRPRRHRPPAEQPWTTQDDGRRRRSGTWPPYSETIELDTIQCAMSS